MKNKLTKVAGASLRVGDVLMRNGTEEEITGLRDYTGQNASVYPGGAQVASLLLGGEVIIDNLDRYTIVVDVVPE